MAGHFLGRFTGLALTGDGCEVKKLNGFCDSVPGKIMAVVSADRKMPKRLNTIR